ncbi:hypothetical protein BDZ91DRAFT_505203 [Kalaharituber pfeilii]|nr:hypothetical protein BDZ91DRAFT_505203 [Kalaharituber pfeilii]
MFADFHLVRPCCIRDCSEKDKRKTWDRNVVFATGQLATEKGDIRSREEERERRRVVKFSLSVYLTIFRLPQSNVFLVLNWIGLDIVVVLLLISPVYYSLKFTIPTFFPLCYHIKMYVKASLFMSILSLCTTEGNKMGLAHTF